MVSIYERGAEMLEAICISFSTGYILGSCATIILILFLMAARPDTPRKMREDWEGLKEYFKGLEVKKIEKRLRKEGRKHDKEVRKLIKQGRYEG